MTKNTKSPPLSLYIHMPWCIKKCPYCDFNSHTMTTPLAEEGYIAALLADLKQDLSRVANRDIHSIFIGGGTPSLFSGTAYQQLFKGIRSLVAFEDKLEITLEANPGSFDQQNFTAYRDLGINRLSIGVQSFQNDKLQSLGRIHDTAKAQAALTAAAQAGFDNVNIDLMYGLPQQTVQDACYDITTALSFNPHHLSWYQLTLEPNTVFFKKKPTLPDEATLWDIEQCGKALITQHYQHYEISAYSKPGYHSRHNVNYWLFGDYLGIGAGAHGKITALDGRVTRLQKVRQPQDYLSQTSSFIAKEWVLQSADLSFEFMLNCLRLHQEIPWELFTKRTGNLLSHLTYALQRATEQELLLVTTHGFRTTALGQRYLNELQQLFLQV